MDGVIGIWSPENQKIVRQSFLSLLMLNGRGDPTASSGIGAINGEGTYIENGLGRITHLFNPRRRKTYCGLHPDAMIGNVGFTKNEIPLEMDSEPIEIKHKSDSRYEIITTMDGHVVEPKLYNLKKELEDDYKFSTKNLTEVVGSLLHKYIKEEGVSFEAGKRFMDKLEGSSTYSLVSLILDKEKNKTYMITLNDEKAFEPFCYGNINGSFIVSSESISHRVLEGFIDREFKGGEMTICSKDGIDIQRLKEEEPLNDKFYIAYFGNPNSFSQGRHLYEWRILIGKSLVELYKDANINVDIVIPNPDSGRGVSDGIYKGLQKQLESNALVKQPGALRTFQIAKDETRDDELIGKFAGLDFLLKDQYIVIGDDSIVKASVSRGGSVWWLRNCGAKGVEFWVSYGPMFFPSFKEWHRGKVCVEELGIHKAFKNDNPYDKSLDEINKGVAKLIEVEEVRYNTKENLEKLLGPGSYQALDASYPIDQKYWPDFIHQEVAKFQRYHKGFN